MGTTIGSSWNYTVSVIRQNTGTVNYKLSGRRVRKTLKQIPDLVKRPLFVLHPLVSGDSVLVNVASVEDKSGNKPREKKREDDLSPISNLGVPSTINGPLFTIHHEPLPVVFPRFNFWRNEENQLRVKSAKVGNNPVGTDRTRLVVGESFLANHLKIDEELEKLFLRQQH